MCVVHRPITKIDPAIILILKRFTLFCSCILLSGQLQSQTPSQSYRQSLPGSDINFEMVAIPSGTFIMGSTEGPEDENPAHPVHLSAFWMSAHEITWQLYELFLYKDFEARDLNNQLPPDLDAMTRPTRPYIDMTFGMGKINKPALGMTQYNAIQFCKWLYLKTGEFYRLPTEAEWEYACRAESTTNYSFGDEVELLEEYAWFATNSRGTSQLIGTKKPNAWGLYDMHGNVAEWTYDQYHPEFYKQHKDGTVKNPVNPPEKLYPISVRGGSYLDTPDQLRSAARMASDPYWKQLDPQIPKSNWWFTDAPFVGIRLVRPANPPSPEEIMRYYDKKPIADY